MLPGGVFAFLPQALCLGVDIIRRRGMAGYGKNQYRQFMAGRNACFPGDISIGLQEIPGALQGRAVFPDFRLSYDVPLEYYPGKDCFYRAGIPQWDKPLDGVYLFYF